MRQHIFALLALTFALSACTTPGGGPRGPASSDDATARLHDQKVHTALDRADAKAALR